MSMYSFYILPLMEKFHLDLTCFHAGQEPSAKSLGQNFHLLTLVKQAVYLHVQVIFQTWRSYLCLCFLPRRIHFFYYKVYLEKQKRLSIFSWFWIDTAERHFEREKENACGRNGRSASAIKFLPLPSCTSEQVIVDIYLYNFFYL